MNDTIEDAPVATRMSDTKIAEHYAQNHSTDDAPAEASTTFNSMAEKLDSAMKPFQHKQAQQEPSSAPQSDDERSPRRAADWKALKAQKAAAEKRASELEQQLQSPTKVLADKSEIESLRKRATELETALKQSALEKHPEFANRFKARFAESKAKLDALFTGPVSHLLDLPLGPNRDDALSSLRAKLNGVAVARFDSALSAYDAARIEHESALADASRNLERAQGLQAERAARERELARARLTEHSEQVIAKMRSQFPSFSGENREAAENLAKRFFSGQLSPEETQLAPFLMSEGLDAQHLRKKVAELEATVSEYQRSRPRPSGGPPREHAPAKPQSFIEAFKANWTLK